MRSSYHPILLFVAALAASCGPSADERAAAHAAALSNAEEEALSLLEAQQDSIADVLAEQPPLTANERYQLRQFLNAEQVAAARRLGVDPPADTADVRRLVREGQLVELEDSTRYWVVRELTHSFPYVTEDAHAMLTELGQRFHARLDSLGLPPFRFEITSALRTGALQEDLRGGNPNASRSTSSHEFGTTVDIAYRDFAPPADAGADLPLDVPDSLDIGREDLERLERDVRAEAAGRLVEVASEHASNLKGILGNILKDMQEEGASLPLHERGQAVFHVTVGDELSEG